MHNIKELATQLLPVFLPSVNNEAKPILVLDHHHDYYNLALDIVVEAHESTTLSDWIYSTVFHILQDISEGSATTVVDIIDETLVEADIYTSDLFEWFNRFYYYCDIVSEQYELSKNVGILEMIETAQVFHKREILANIVYQLADYLDNN